MLRKREALKLALSLLQLLAGIRSARSADRQVLLDFKASQGSCAGRNEDIQSWDLSKDLSAWRGITWSFGSSGLALQKLRVSGPVCGALPETFSRLLALEAFEWTLSATESDRFVGGVPSSWSVLTRLTSLVLSGHALSSTLPPSWSSLTHLQRLYLDGNVFTGALPSTWSMLTQLEDIKLNNNLLSGSVPSQWSTLLNLGAQGTAVDLHSNRLSGALPVTWSCLTRLSLVDFSANYFTGPLPHTWSVLTQLQLFNLSNNSLSSTLPASWSTLQRLTSLSLQHNQLSAGIPDSWSTLQSLHTMDFSGNPMSGALPDWISQLKKLATLSVPGSESHGQGMPDWLSQFGASLKVLSLPGYGYRGSLPMWLAGFQQLHTLNLSSNSFTGAVPALVAPVDMSGTIPSSPSAPPPPGPQDATSTVVVPLVSIDLSNNSLHGPLPSSWEKITTLTTVDLTSNKVDGSLPSSWAGMSRLEQLALTACALTGTLPASWSSLSSLRVLSLSQNNLTGTIPTVWQHGNWWQACVFADVSDNQLEGPIPALPDTMQYFNASHNNFTGGLSAVPSSLTCLHVAHNRLTGTIPPIASRYIVYLNFANNQFTQLPGSFYAPHAILVSMANNRLMGTLPADLPQQSLAFLYLNNNELSGPIPASWASRDWQQIALQGNSLSGSLPAVWPGKVSVLHLANNIQLTGCLPKEWIQNQSVSAVSLSNTAIKCSLPEEYSSGDSFNSLTLLGLDNSHITGTVPPSWLQGFRNETVLLLGSVWLTSLQESQGLSNVVFPLMGKNWRQQVCASKSLSSKMGSDTERVMNVTELIRHQLNDALSRATANLTQMLQRLGPAPVVFEIEGTDLLPHSNKSGPNIEDMCGNRAARQIVAIQLAVVLVTILCLVLMYSVDKWLQVARKWNELRGPQFMASSAEDKLTWRQWCLQSSRVGKYALNMLLYWLVITLDVIVLVEVWSVGGWPKYALLTVLLLHCAMIVVLLSAHVPAVVGRRRTVWWVPVAVLLVPALPLIDIVMICATAVQTVRAMSHRRAATGLLSHNAIDIAYWQGLFRMRTALQTLVEALPNAIVLSAIFVVGSQPHQGVYLDMWLFVLATVACYLQIVKLVAAVLLWSALKTEFSPGQALKEMFHLERKPRAPLPDNSSEDDDHIYLRQSMQEL